MLSVIVKTVIIFLLVIIVVHLIIIKPLDISPPPPQIHDEKTIDHMVDQLIEKKIDNIFPIVQSSTVITPPQISPHKIDDLFNYVYNDTSDKKQKSISLDNIPDTVPTSNTAPISNTAPASTDAVTPVEGVCAFEDEGSSVYGVF